MLSLRSTALAIVALLFVTSVSAQETAENVPRAVAPFQSHQAIAEKRMLRTRSNRLDKVDVDVEKRDTTTVVQLQTILTVLQTTTAPITVNIQKIVQAAPTTPKATTQAALTAQYSSLETAINTAVAGVTRLAGQVKGDVNLNNLAGTLFVLVQQIEVAYFTVFYGLAQDLALAPLVQTLGNILTGPLGTLLTGVQGAAVGLLPTVNGLLGSLGLAPILSGVTGLVGGLLGGLGL